MSEPTTVEAALLRLTERDEKGRSAVEDYDVDFLHALAERVRRNIELSGKQRRAAYRAIAGYVPVLRELGVDFDTIVAPEDPIAVQPRRTGRAVNIMVANGRIYVHSPFKFKDVCKAIPESRWNAQAKAWTYPETEAAAHAIRSAFRGAPTTEDIVFTELADAYEHRAAASEAARHQTDLPDVPHSKTEAWEHQRQAFWFAKDLPAAMLAMDMGTGKSKVTVDLLVNNDARRVLILCPVSVMAVWPREFRVHAGANCEVVVLSGNIAERMRTADEFLHDGRDEMKVLVTNYEGAYREPFATWAQKQSWDYVVCDESHRIKSPAGVWSKFAHKAGKHSARRLALTGTPMAQSPLDIFGQYRFLDESIFGLSKTSFERRYAIKGGYGGYEVVGYQREEELAEKFYSIAFRVDSDVLDLLPSRDDYRECELSPQARKLYKAVSDDMYGELAEDGGEVTVSNVLTKLLRLQEITGGAIHDDEGNIQVVDHSKGDLLSDVLTDIGPDEPVVVFCRFVHDLDVVQSVAQSLKRRYGELSGRRRDALNEDAHMADDIDVAAVQIQAGGVGVDFTRSHFGIYYSLGYSLTDYLQSRKRLDRPGQEHSVLFLHLTARDTVDPKVYEALTQHKEVVDYVLDLGA